MKVRCRELDGSYVGAWNDHRIAAKWAECRSNDILRCCENKRKSAGGYRWEYV